MDASALFSDPTFKLPEPTGWNDYNYLPTSSENVHSPALITHTVLSFTDDPRDPSCYSDTRREWAQFTSSDLKPKTDSEDVPVLDYWSSNHYSNHWSLSNINLVDLVDLVWSSLSALSGTDDTHYRSRTNQYP